MALVTHEHEHHVVFEVTPRGGIVPMMSGLACMGIGVLSAVGALTVFISGGEQLTWLVLALLASVLCLLATHTLAVETCCREWLELWPDRVCVRRSFGPALERVREIPLQAIRSAVPRYPWSEGMLPIAPVEQPPVSPKVCITLRPRGRVLFGYGLTEKERWEVVNAIRPRLTRRDGRR